MTGDDKASDPAAPMVSLREAASRTGRHPDAIRSLVRRGRLRSRRGNDGKVLVELAAWLLAGADHPLAGPQAGPDSAADEAMAELRDEIAELRVELARAEAKRDAAIATATAERAAMLEVIADLRGEVAWHRRPWWRRLLG